MDIQLTSSGREQSRARYPDSSGYVKRDGVRSRPSARCSSRFRSGAQRGLILAAEHPDRVSGAVFVCPAVPLASPLADGARYPFDEVLPDSAGWPKDKFSGWVRDYRGFLEFFFSQMFTEPHSTKPPPGFAARCW